MPSREGAQAAFTQAVFAQPAFTEAVFVPPTSAAA